MEEEAKAIEELDKIEGEVIKKDAIGPDGYTDAERARLKANLEKNKKQHQRPVDNNIGLDGYTDAERAKLREILSKYKKPESTGAEIESDGEGER